jgi:hypothetical protein
VPLEHKISLLHAAARAGSMAPAFLESNPYLQLLNCSLGLLPCSMLLVHLLHVVPDTCTKQEAGTKLGNTSFSGSYPAHIFIAGFSEIYNNS